MRVLVAESENFNPQALKELQTIGEVCLADLNREGLLHSIKDIDILWIRLRNQIDKQLLRGGPTLKWIVSPTTGLNHIDLDEAEQRGITVLSLQGEGEFLKSIRATAELALGLALTLLRQICPAAADVCNGGWNRELFRGNELYEKTVGLIGYGRLGRMVAGYYRAFGCRVLAHDPHVGQEEVEPGVEWVSREGLLQTSDIVSLHVNLSGETEGFFCRASFAAMKPGAWFINTSRGELIDEEALLDALKSGHLVGAALDVIQNEQHLSHISNHPLVAYAREHAHLILSPHMGGCTHESMKKTELFLAKKLCVALS